MTTHRPAASRALCLSILALVAFASIGARAQDVNAPEGPPGMPPPSQPPPSPPGEPAPAGGAPVEPSSPPDIALYPNLRFGYVFGGVTRDKVQSDVGALTLEPQLVLLYTRGRFGVGADVGYTFGMGDALGQVGIGADAIGMFALTPRIILRASGGYATGSVKYTDDATRPGSYDAHSFRFGGGLFFILTRTHSTDVAIGVGFEKWLGSDERQSSGVTNSLSQSGLMFDAAISRY